MPQGDAEAAIFGALALWGSFGLMAFGAMSQALPPELHHDMLLHLAMSEAPHAIVDPQGRCTWLTRGFWRVITTTPPAYWPMDFLPASFPADLRSWITNSSQNWQELLQWLQHSGKNMTITRPRPDQRGTLEWQISLLPGAANQPITEASFWVSVQDVTHRQHHELTRLEILQRYENAIQGSFDGLWEWNFQTGHVWLSPRYHELMGCTQTLPPVPESLFDFILEEDRTAVADQLGAYNHGRSPKFEIVCRARKRNGDVRWLLVRAINQKDSQGRLLKIIGSHTDITQLILAEQILLDAIEGIQDGFALFSTDDKLLLCNERYLEIYPYSRNLVPLIGRSFEELLREGLRVGYFADDLALSDPEQWLQERLVFHRTPNGPPIEQKLADGRWIQIRERVTKEGGIVGIRSDITALKQRALELDEAKKRAEHANEAKTSFLATISHELRTPMTGVIGMAELLRTTNLDEDQRRYTELLQRSARSMLDLLNDMLDLSKIEAGRLDLEIIPVDLYNLVRDVVDLFRPRAEEKRIGIGFHFDRRVPSLIQGDPTRLRQILFNLVSNAVKFTESGSVQIRVAVIPSQTTNLRLMFEVEDTGIGISTAQIETIFEPFQQAETSTARRFGGSGLGLAICKKLVTAMDGTIEVSSQPDKGTIFTVCIDVQPDADQQPKAIANSQPVAITVPPTPITPPISEPVAEPVPPVQTSPPSSDTIPVTRPLQILLAEDNQTTSLLVRSILDKRGHTIICVPNGKAALEAVQQHTIDVILMDANMPDMDGTTATKMIRTLPPPLNAVPIYALTADVMPEKRQLLLASGMNGVLGKPIDWHALDQTLGMIGRPIEPPRTPPITEITIASPLPIAPAPATATIPKGLDGKKWAEMVDLLGFQDARGLCLHGILDAEDMVSEIGDLLHENQHRPGREGRYFHLVHSLSGLLANIGALEWASLCRKLHQDDVAKHRIEWLEMIREGLTALYDLLQN